MHEIKVPKLDLLAILGAMPTDNSNNSNQIHFDFKDTDMYVPRWQDMNPDTDGYPEGLIAHHLSWTTIGLIIVLLCICIYLAVWLYRRRVKIKFFFADALLDKLGAKREITNVKYSTKAPDSVVIDSLDKGQEDPTDV